MENLCDEHPGCKLFNLLLSGDEQLVFITELVFLLGNKSRAVLPIDVLSILREKHVVWISSAEAIQIANWFNSF